MLDFRKLANMAEKIPNVMDLQIDEDTVTFIAYDTDFGFTPFEIERSYFETYIPTEYEQSVIDLINRL